LVLAGMQNDVLS